MKVKFDHITKEFGSTVAVKDFSAELTDGHLICLLGPSGCGKSTLLNMLCGITPVTQGHIYFDDEDVTKLPSDQRNIGMVFQNYALYPHMTVLENICFPLEVKKVPKKERILQAEKIAKLVHIDMLLKRYPGELSGGQQQRVAIARALVKNPKLLLMDEPLSNLDARLRLEMRDEIRRIQQETGVTTVFVTHDQEEAMSISDSIILMKDGVLVQSGICNELYNNPECKFVADFLGNPPINKLNLPTQEISQIFKEAGITAEIPSDCENLVTSIRPESFVSGGKLKAKVISVSEMGKDQILKLDFMNNIVQVVMNLDEIPSAGDMIDVGLKKKGIFLFDSESGKRLV